MVQDWLYEEGEDETKSTYVAKLNELRQVGQSPASYTLSVARRLCSVHFTHVPYVAPCLWDSNLALLGNCGSNIKLFHVMQVTLWKDELLSSQCDRGQQRACSKRPTTLPARPPAQTPSTPTYLLQTNRR